MKYIKSEKYFTERLLKKIMGPNPVKLCEELLIDNKIAKNGVVCDLGSGQGLTSVFMAKEYGFTVYAADLWSDPEENRKFFDEEGVARDRIYPIKTDACDLPFEKNFFDAVVSTDSYNYFGRDEKYLDEKLLPFVKNGGYVYISVLGLRNVYDNNFPSELLLSWSPEQLEYIKDIKYWIDTVSACQGAEVLSVKEMVGNEEVWNDWLKQDNEYAIGDRKAMAAGAGKYLSFISIVLRKK